MVNLQSPLVSNSIVTEAEAVCAQWVDYGFQMHKYQQTPMETALMRYHEIFEESALYEAADLEKQRIDAQKTAAKRQTVAAKRADIQHKMQKLQQQLAKLNSKPI
jgi:hypothetical protein